jgi:hypothetical protein
VNGTLESSLDEAPVDDEPDFGPGQSCKHCGRAIAAGDPKTGWVHALDSGHNGKSRCDPSESRLPYGYNAEPEGAPCQSPCIGARFGPSPR